MFIIREDKTIDLNKFEKIEYRESFGGDFYYVEAIRTMPSGGLFGGTVTKAEKIACPREKKFAQKLVHDITEAWINEDKKFDVDKWFENNTEN